LKRAREKKRMSVEDVYKQIKIHPSYLKALETDNYTVFSGKVHSKGFLKLYSDFLGLNVLEVMALWRREYEHEFEDKKEERFFQKKYIETPNFIITPTAILITFVFVAVMAFFGYLYYQYKNFTGAPALNIYYPADNLVTETSILDITGKTDLDSEVYINNQKIILGPDGSFAESVKLKEGLNTISIRSVNKLAKSTEYVRTIIFRPEEIEIPVLKEVAGESTQSTGSEELP